VLLKSWPLEATLFDGDLLAGLVPTLFSKDVEASLAAIQGDPLKAHWDLNKISKTLFMPESVSIQEAVNIIKKPR